MINSAISNQNADVPNTLIDDDKKYISNTKHNH